MNYKQIVYKLMCKTGVILVYITHLTLKLSLIIILWTTRAILFVTTHLHSSLEFICVKSKLFTLLRDPLENFQPYEKKFSETDILSMSQKIKNKDMILKEIAERFNISYRQAKKVKDQADILENSPDIHSVYSA